MRPKGVRQLVVLLFFKRMGVNRLNSVPIEAFFPQQNARQGAGGFRIEKAVRIGAVDILADCAVLLFRAAELL